MTQHYLTPNSDSPDHVVLVGWDRRDATFFARVYRDAGSGPEHILWEGMSRGEYTNATDIVEFVKSYVDTSKVKLTKVTAALYRDQYDSRTASSAQANAVTHW